MATPAKIRYRNKDYPVIDSMRLGGQTYLILDRLSGGFPERFWAYTRSGSRDGLMWTIHLLPNSKATRTRLETLRRISESNGNVPTLVGYYRYGDQLAAVCKWVHGISVRDYLNAVEKRKAAGVQFLRSQPAIPTDSPMACVNCIRSRPSHMAISSPKTSSFRQSRINWS